MTVKSSEAGRNCQTLTPKTLTPKTLAPGLYIVATPVGNLGDITIRALEVLKSADLIACEDTRVTGKLLAHFGIGARTTSYHDHNEADKSDYLVSLLREGKTIALVSDAGTPLISDPGHTLVRKAAAAGIKVIPIPGASSVTAALSASGLPVDRFLFSGFLPAKAVARAKLTQKLKSVPVTLIFFESVHRLPASLAALSEILGPREAVVARELTKLYEEFRRGTLEELAAHYAQAGEPKGEVVLLIAPSQEDRPVGDIDAMLGQALLEMSVKDAAASLAKETGLPRQELYARALALKALK